MINKGQYIKVIFKNNTLIEGIVESWSDQQSILKSADGSNLFIIFQTLEDVMAVKIVLNYCPPGELNKRLLQTQSKFEEVKASPSNDDLRIKRLSELRKELIKQEKEIVAHQLKEHAVSGTSRVNYGIPNLINTKPRAK